MDGLRIATVSDIHLGPLRGRAHTERIVAVINRLDADLVAVVGDLVDGSVAELGPAAAPLRDLRSRYGSFFVTGNHEYYSGVEEWVARGRPARAAGRCSNERRRSGPGGVLDLAGVNDVTGGGHRRRRPGLRRGARRPRPEPAGGAARAPAGRRPTRRPRYGVDLQLSGHTHGGQMVPFNLVVGLRAAGGQRARRGRRHQVYVTNGAGFWGPPVRVGAPPQITLVELRSRIAEVTSARGGGRPARRA